MQERKVPKRLIIDVSHPDHTRVKKLAKQQGISIRRLVIDALALYIKRHKNLV